MTARRIRIAFWMLAALLGSAQTWYTRHRIFSDGISYLEIAREYANGNWHAAINAYWSPLYSWVVAVYLLIFRPGPYWDVSALHVVNFAMFLASCWIFEKFLIELIRARSAALAGFSAKTLTITGYLAILHGGILMVGMGYVSPDMIAYFLTGLAAWLTLKIARSEAPGWYFAALGITLGFGYLDRTAFAPLSAFYILAAAAFLVKNRVRAIGLAALCGACMVVVGAPFAIALTMQKGAFTMGESGKLNYGWEVDGAARSAHWQGEPGDIGTPVHPTRIILKEPVPVYEFGQPVPGSYPPWRDPSYWYEGIQPHLKVREQLKVLWLNLRATAFYAASAPAFLILCLALAISLGKGNRLRDWPAAYWALMLPAAVGIAMYCLVYVDKRYIAGFFVVLWMTALAGIAIPEGRLGRYTDVAAQSIALLVLLALGVWLRPAFAMSLTDAAHGREGEYNVSWMLAHRFEELGVKPGDPIAYIGDGISADWVRLAGARIVAEIPVRYERDSNITNGPLPTAKFPLKFFGLDEASRETVYAAFRKAGAVIAVANEIPGGGLRGDWTRVLDPAGPYYPKSKGQMLLEAPAYYRWLVSSDGPRH